MSPKPVLEIYWTSSWQKEIDGVLMDELAVQCPQSLNRVMTNYRNKPRETSCRFPFKVTLKIHNQGEIKTLRGLASHRRPFSCPSILCKIIIMKEKTKQTKTPERKGPLFLIFQRDINQSPSIRWAVLNMIKLLSHFMQVLVHYKFEKKKAYPFFESLC